MVSQPKVSSTNHLLEKSHFIVNSLSSSTVTYSKAMVKMTSQNSASQIKTSNFSKTKLKKTSQASLISKILQQKQKKRFLKTTYCKHLSMHQKSCIIEFIILVMDLKTLVTGQQQREPRVIRKKLIQFHSVKFFQNSKGNLRLRSSVTVVSLVNGRIKPSSWLNQVSSKKNMGFHIWQLLAPLLRIEKLYGLSTENSRNLKENKIFNKN